MGLVELVPEERCGVGGSRHPIGLVALLGGRGRRLIWRSSRCRTEDFEHTVTSCYISTDYFCVEKYDRPVQAQRFFD